MRLTNTSMYDGSFGLERIGALDVVARRNKVFLWAGLLILFSWLSIALLNPESRGVFETLSLGYFFGSLFAHATLAAAWAALGPGRLVWRMPLSLIWVAMLAIALAINVALNGGPKGAPTVLGACLFAQWLLLQFPLWALAIGYGCHLRHVDDAALEFDPRRSQFGIRQLIIVTTIVGVVFGIGRLVVTNLGEDLNLGRAESPTYLFLAAAAIVLTLPLLLAALMRRMIVPGILLALCLIGVATAFELPLLKSFHRGPGPQTIHLIAINAITATVVLIVVAIVRWNGYSLARSGLTKPAA